MTSPIGRALEVSVLVACWLIYGVFAWLAVATFTPGRPGTLLMFVLIHIAIGMGRWPHQVWLFPLAIVVAPYSIFALWAASSGESFSLPINALGLLWIGGGMALAAAALAAGGWITARVNGSTLDGGATPSISK